MEQIDELQNIPIQERHLAYEIAAPWFKVSDQAKQLEGLCFDREGNLYFVEVFGGTIYKLILPEKRLIEVCTLANENPAALKIHKDGRLFVCCLGNFADSGSLVAIDPKTGESEVIIAKTQGYVIDDMIFDSDDGFYFSDFKGYSCDPLGGIYHVSADFRTIIPVIKNMAVPNGLCLSPDEKILWITEMSNNRLHAVQLEEDRVTIPAFGTAVPYHFSGLEGPDSCCLDSKGNVYVAMYQQGRVLIFNDHGLPIKQVLLPGRGENHMLRSTHPMLIPDTQKLLICSNDWDGGQGSWIFSAEAEALAHKMYQFQ